MKPDSIRKFDWLYLGSIAVSLIGIAIGWGEISAQMHAELVRQGIALSEDLAGAAIIGSIGIGIAIGLVLWLLLSVFRLEFVKWILVLLVAWSVFSSLGAVTAGQLGLTTVLGLISTLMSAVAAVYLFKPDAKAWFAERRGGGDPA